NLKTAIDENGAAGKGQHFNELGRDVQAISNRTITEAAPEGASVEKNVRVGQGTGAEVDNTIEYGDQKLALETKYSLPEPDTSAATRLNNQVINGARQVGPNGRVIVNTIRQPTQVQANNFLRSLPSNVASRVQIVSNQAAL